MRTKTIVALSLAGFAFALWLARGGDPPSSPAANAPAATTAPSPLAAAALHLPRAARSARAAQATATATSVRKLDPKSYAYANRMDDQIPTHLYAEASRCYKGGLQRDQRIDLTYKIRVDNGKIALSDVQVVESTLNDPALESCVVSTVANATWRDDELPDLHETGDLYMRVAGFSAYLANAEDDDSAGGEAMN